MLIALDSSRILPASSAWPHLTHEPLSFCPVLALLSEILHLFLLVVGSLSAVLTMLDDHGVFLNLSSSYFTGDSDQLLHPSDVLRILRLNILQTHHPHPYQMLLPINTINTCMQARDLNIIGYFYPSSSMWNWFLSSIDLAFQISLEILHSYSIYPHSACHLFFCLIYYSNLYFQFYLESPHSNKNYLPQSKTFQWLP